MRKFEITLSLFFDGQFFTGLFELTDECEYRVAKKIFMTKPSDAEIMAFVLEDYYTLCFTNPQKNSQHTLPKAIKNPKRRQREAAKAIKKVQSSTKAQAVLQAQREQKRILIKKQNSKNKRDYADAQFELRRQKRKQKHRGR